MAISKVINLSGPHTLTVSGIAVINGLARVASEEQEKLLTSYLDQGGIEYTSQDYDETNPLHNPAVVASQAVTGIMDVSALMKRTEDAQARIADQGSESGTVNLANSVNSKK